MRDMLRGSICKIVLTIYDWLSLKVIMLLSYILHWFYLSSRFALTGYLFGICGHRPRSIFSGTRLMKGNGKKK